MIRKINMITVVFFPMQKLPVKEKKKKPGIIYLSSIPEVRQFLHFVRRYRYRIPLFLKKVDVWHKPILLRVSFVSMH